MKKILKWIGNIITFIIVVMIVLLAVFNFKAMKNPGKIPSVFGYKTMTVLTGSMQPSIKPGDMIVVRDIKEDKVKVGDVVTYKVDEKTFVTHRVIEVTEENGKKMVRTKGDANNTDDKTLIPPEDLVGSLAFKIPYGGYVLRFVQSPQGFVVLFIIPAVLLILSELKTILPQLKGSKKKESDVRDNME